MTSSYFFALLSAVGCCNSVFNKEPNAGLTKPMLQVVHRGYRLYEENHFLCVRQHRVWCFQHVCGDS